jgi:DNA repair protein RadC
MVAPAVAGATALSSLSEGWVMTGRILSQPSDRPRREGVSNAARAMRPGKPAAARSDGPAIRDWPVHERPRERLIARGAADLSDTELLAVFLATGSAGHGVLDLARTLLARFGSLRALLAADCRRACDAPGIGPARWARLQATLEMIRRSLREELQAGDALDSPAAVRQFLTLWLRERPYESFVTLFLDSQNRLLTADELFRGTLGQTAVYPREVARRALQVNAAAVILAHNHPSGVAQPSAADRMLTDALKAALGQLDIPVLDHVIVAGNVALSFAERGLL